VLHKFVESIPDKIQNGVLYISLTYTTAIHKCACGCGEEVVTPFSPTDWKLIFDGETVSLHPSIGNWGFKCKSHYWIKSDSINWAGSFTSTQIKAVKQKDIEEKDKYYNDQVSQNGKVGILTILKNWYNSIQSKIQKKG